MKKQSFLYGATVLAIASVLCKMMSAVFKIPLDRFFLHEEGIAIYQSAYSVYNVFLAIFVTGIPLALSSLIALSPKDAPRLYKSTSYALTIVCVVCAVIIFLFSEPLAKLLSGSDEPLAAPSLKVICAAVLVMGVISSRRGYFQGRRNMTPSALSQLAESLVKVVFGIGLCALFIKKGISFGAAGAILGATTGALCSALVLGIFMRKEEKIKAKPSFKTAKKVILLSIPMTLGAFGFTAVMLIDSLSVASLLKVNGLETMERLKNFGYLTRANTIYNLPATIITAFTASAVPALSSALSEKDSDNISKSAIKVIKLVFIVAFPSMLGMAFFAKEILTLLYQSAFHWQLLCLAGLMVIIMPYVQTTTAMLQAMGKVWLPITVQALAVVLKVTFNFVFIRIMGIEGAIVATIAAFIPAALVNTVIISSMVKVKELFKILLKLFLCALTACTVAKVFYSLFETTPIFLVSLIIAAIIYFTAIVALGCIKKEEFIK